MQRYAGELQRVIKQLSRWTTLLENGREGGTVAEMSHRYVARWGAATFKAMKGRPHGSGRSLGRQATPAAFG